MSLGAAQSPPVSPVFEVGGQGRNAHPWDYDPDTVRRFGDAVRLHEILLPYLYSLARRATITGEPIVRPLAFDFPRDEQAWSADQHLMVGRHLLPVPVTADRAETDGAAGQPTPVTVYLPAGRWLDLFTGAVVTGGRHLIRDTTLDESPSISGSTRAHRPRIWTEFCPPDSSQPIDGRKALA